MRETIRAFRASISAMLHPLLVAADLLMTRSTGSRQYGRSR